MLRVNQKKIISLLLVGVTLVSGEYNYILNGNKNDNKKQDDNNFSKNIIIDNGNSFIDVLNSIDKMTCIW